MPKQGGKPRTSMDALLVRIDTDEGVTGWGEGFGHRIFTATRAARVAAGPDFPIMIDCNGPWTIDEGIATPHKLKELNPKWLEEPSWPPEHHQGLARVQVMGGIPTAAGENAMLPEFKSMFEHGAITYAQPQGAGLGLDPDPAVIENLRAA